MKMTRLGQENYLKRMTKEVMSKRIFHNSRGGRRLEGRPRKRWLDSIEYDLRRLGVRGWMETIGGEQKTIQLYCGRWLLCSWAVALMVNMPRDTPYTHSNMSSRLVSVLHVHTRKQTFTNTRRFGTHNYFSLNSIQFTHAYFSLLTITVYSLQNG